MTSRQWWFEVVKQTYLTTKHLSQVEPEELDELLPKVFDLLYDDVFGTKQGWALKDNVEYTLTKLREWRDKGAGPKIGVIANFDDRLHGILKDLGIHGVFDFVLTSYECRSQKPDPGMFTEAVMRTAGYCQGPAHAYHVGDSIDTDILGANAAGWNGMRLNEWFDEELPDWSETDTPETADAGAARHAAFQQWGRRDTSRTSTGEEASPGEGALEWVEIWSLDDVLKLFGLPDDPNKPIKTTYIRNVLGDE